MPEKIDEKERIQCAGDFGDVEDGALDGSHASSRGDSQTGQNSRVEDTVLPSTVSAQIINNQEDSKEGESDVQDNIQPASESQDVPEKIEEKERVCVLNDISGQLGVQVETAPDGGTLPSVAAEKDLHTVKEDSGEVFLTSSATEESLKRTMEVANTEPGHQDVSCTQSSPESGKNETFKSIKNMCGLILSQLFRKAEFNRPGLNHSAKPSSSTKKTIPKQELVCFGLPNLGMTCYMNSILQSLLNLNCFVQEIHKQLPVWRLLPGSQLFRWFLDIEASRFTNIREDKMLVLSTFKWTVAEYNSDFDDDEQKDAHEFLVCVLDIMRSMSSEVELTAVNSGLTYTCPVQEHITLQMLNVRTCRGCGEQSYRLEDFNNLSLDLVPGGTVGQCLQEYLKENQIEFTCHCGAQQSSLQSSFSTLPNVLILHLKRFIVTRSYTVNKMKNPITLSKELVLKEEYMANRNTTARYSLVSVVSHMGSSADSGHYICDSIYGRPDMGDSANLWLTYNDERVSQTTAEDVCRRRETTAFLLFYEKQALEELTHLPSGLQY
ncbi:ubiquitin carboxyl-terminal hydrolase 37-like [Fundulus heteroclitus]|uniref:ubiquitin carboxyl-terminal hydrolase 37-like n=1 Tax=Fundulus heteroclitus TaxID=8078 RepID=UPI00165B6050|nr:ubiquitin carboxyl-terminal hydrolase 37-like [Fundulus heteroclitus]